MPAAIERRIVCAVEPRRGQIVTLCGVELEVGVEGIEEEIATCPVCIEERERRWGDSSQD